jgi:hypothetical protein
MLSTHEEHLRMSQIAAVGLARVHSVRGANARYFRPPESMGSPMRYLAVFALCAGCGRLRFDPASDAASVPAATRRNRIDLAGARIGAALADVPVLVRLRTPAVDLGAAQADGADLRFFAADQVTSLPYEIEPGAASGFDVWVRVPVLGGGLDSTIWLTYGDPAALAPVGSDPVWSSDFIAVWHLGADSRDSTSNHLDATPAGTTLVAGVAGLGRDLQGGWLTIPESPTTATIAQTGSLTISAALNLSSDPPSSSTIVTRQTDATSLDDFRMGPGAAGELDGQVTTDPGLVTTEFGLGHVDLGTWTLLAITWDGAALSLNVGGATGGSMPATGTIHVSSNGLILGAGCNACGGTPSGDFVPGVIDEVRIESVVRSDDWLTAEALDLADQLAVVQPFESL